MHVLPAWTKVEHSPVIAEASHLSWSPAHSWHAVVAQVLAHPVEPLHALVRNGSEHR